MRWRRCNATTSVSFKAKRGFSLRDCYDHALRIIELVESHQTMCSDLMDLQMSWKTAA